MALQVPGVWLGIRMSYVHRPGRRRQLADGQFVLTGAGGAGGHAQSGARLARGFEGRSCPALPGHHGITGDRRLGADGRPVVGGIAEPVAAGRT